MSLKALITTMTFVASLILSTSSHAGVSDLLGSLTGQLGVSEEQAAAGAGALFGYSQKELGDEQFSQVASALPGIESLIPKGTPSGSGGNSLMSSASSMLKGTSLDGMAALTSSFSALGLDPDMVSQYVPIVLDYAQSEGGQTVMEMLKSTLMP